MPRLSLALCAALACIPPAFADAPSFDALVVQPQPGFVNVQAVKVNDHGDFCAQQTAGDGTHHFSLWLHDIGFTEIPAPGDRRIASCNALNDEGAVAGTTAAGAFFWSPARGWIDIVPPGPGAYVVTPYAINESDEVVGTLARKHEPRHSKGFTWTPQGGTRLLSAKVVHEAKAINDAGAIAFDSWRDGRSEAGLIQDGAVTTVGFAGALTGTYAVDVNAAGEMAVDGVGGPVQYQAGFWSSATGLVSIFGAQSATAIDAAGDVLVRTNDNVSALWGADYGLVRLANLVSESGTPATNLVAFDMSPSGVAGGAGTVGGIACAIVFMPIRP